MRFAIAFAALLLCGCVLQVQRKPHQPPPQPGPAPVKPAPIKPIPVKPAPMPLTEDLLSFNPNNVRVVRVDGRYKVSEGTHWLLDCGKGRSAKAEAERCVKIIKHYRLSKIGYVGRPGPSMTYWLSGKRAPAGMIGGEDSIAFDPANLAIRRINNRWKLVEGSHHILDFPNQTEANTALRIIRKYGFTRICFVGRPFPSMTYFRR
jgi:hypothetical protein